MRKSLSCIAVLLLTVSSAVGQIEWVNLENVSALDKLTDEQIRTTLDAAFAQTGLKKVEGDGSADLVIGYQA